MCQIYVRLENCEKLPADIVTNESYTNKDGAGIAWVDNDTIQVLHTFNYSTVESTMRELEKENKQFIVHFRYSTAGNKDIGNLHPFFITDDLIMFHNGTIYEFSGDSQKSDTRLFSEFLAGMGIQTIEDVKLFEKEIIELIGTSYDKLVFMDNKGEIYIINDWIGEYSECGLLWSSSINPFYENKKSKRFHKKAYANTWDYYDNEYNYFDYNNPMDIANSIFDSYGNFSQNELDILQYLIDYEPDKIKQAINNSKLYKGVCR
jgi:hypothetical protein